MQFNTGEEGTAHICIGHLKNEFVRSLIGMNTRYSLEWATLVSKYHKCSGNFHSLALRMLSAVEAFKSKSGFTSCPVCYCERSGGKSKNLVGTSKPDTRNPLQNVMRARLSWISVREALEKVRTTSEHLSSGKNDPLGEYPLNHPLGTVATNGESSDPLNPSSIHTNVTYLDVTLLNCSV